MQKIIAPIDPTTTQIDAISNLQDVLQFLVRQSLSGIIEAFRPLIAPNSPTREMLEELLGQLSSDRKYNVYGEATKELVRFFQFQNRLDENLNGFVEKDTAQMLNKFLTQLGAISESQPSQFVVKGTIRQANGDLYSGAIVRAFDRDLRNEQLLGETTTDRNGYYEIAYNANQFQRAEKVSADLIVRIFNPQQPNEEIPNLIITDDKGNPLDTISLQSAQGETRTAIWFNAPAIAIVNFSLISDRILSEWERITLAMYVFLQGQKIGTPSTPPIFIPPYLTQLLVSQSRQPFRNTSVSYIDLPPDELQETDLEFILREVELDREQLRLWTLAAQAAKNTTLLNDKQLRNPIAWLSEVQPHYSSLSQAYLVEWIAFYGWFRLGLPQQFSELIRRPTTELLESLERAIGQNYIPDGMRQLKDLWQTILNGRRIDETLRPAPEGEPASLGDMLATLPPSLILDRERQIAVAVLLQDNRNPGIGLAEGLKNAGLNDNQAWAVERTLGLQTLTQSHLPLMQSLQLDKLDDYSAKLRDLARYEPVEWREKVEVHGFPPTIEGQDDVQKRQNYADQLAITIENIHPSAWIAYRIPDNRFPVNDEIKTAAQTFLNRNSQFQIGKTPVLSYFNDPDNVVSEGISDIAKVKNEMLKIERIVNCSPRLSIAAKILGEGFESAHAIAQKSREAFLESISIEEPNLIAQADIVYDRAVDTSARAIAVASEYIRASQGNSLAIMQPKAETATTKSLAKAASSETADLATLFGNLDFCECEECTSVYSPAAYLIDLMQVLDGGSKNGEQQTPLDVLLSRRPDLAQVDLTCDNTNTSVPYIDLVLEVLENAVAPITFEIDNSLIDNIKPSDLLNSQRVPEQLRQMIDSKGFAVDTDIKVTVQRQGANWILRQPSLKVDVTSDATSLTVSLYPQTTGSTTELKAVPQHINLEPYKTQLHSQYHPWSLPFDLWREETKVWLEQLNVERYQLMEAFQGENRYNNFDTAVELIGFSKSEADKLTTNVEAWRVWGFATDAAITTDIKDPIGGYPFTPTPNTTPPSWIDVLQQRASLLRHRAGLSQRELMNLLETNFIQSAVTAPYKIQLTGEECDASKMSLSNLNEEALLRMHLFIRLWRKLGWSMPDLDRAISAFPIPLNTSTNNLPASSGFKPAFLIFLANVDRLRQQKGLAIGILLNWYSSRLSTQQYADFSKSGSRILPSTYESLFYDRSVSRPKDPAFELNTNRDGLIPSAETIRSKISVIAAAFAIRPNQIEALLPPAIESLSLAEYYENTDGISVDRNGASGRVIGSAQGNKGRITVGTIIELDLRSVRGTGVNAIVKLQHADITTNPIGTSEMIRTSEPSSPQFIDIPLADLNSEDQPDPITNSTTLGLRRFLYTGTKPLLRIAITDITGTVSLAAKVILAPRVSNIGDSLSLENLGALSRYTSLAKSLRLSIQEFLLAINLTGINPFSSPEQTLKLMDYLQLIRSSGFSLFDLDYLLRHRSLDQSKLVLKNTQTTALLTEIRQGLQQIQQDTALQIDERGDITRKWLAYLQWPSALIDEVLGKNYLGRDRIETGYDANHLPSGITLPASIQYDRPVRRLSISGSVKTSLTTDLDTLAQNAANQTELIAAIARLKATIQPQSGSTIQAETIYDGFNFPPEVTLPNFLEYDKRAKQLILRSKITETEKTEIGALKRTTTPITPPDFDAAIDQLLEALTVVDGIRKRMHSYQLPTFTQSVSFGQTPVAIPQIWTGRFYFQSTSPTTGSLFFVGLMTDIEKEVLLSLLPSNNNYDNAINQLYNSSNSIPSNPAFIDQTTAEQLIFELTTPQDRFAKILEILLPKVRSQLQEKLLVDKTAIAFGMEPAIAERLLQDLRFPINTEELLSNTLLAPPFATSDASSLISREGYEQQYRAVELLFKSGALISRLGFATNQVKDLLDNTWQGLPNLSQLPLRSTTITSFTQWANLAVLSQLPAHLPGGIATLERISSLLKQPPTTSWESFQNVLADFFNWRVSDFDILLGTNGLKFDNDISKFRQPKKIKQFGDCVELILKLGSTAEMAIAWKQSPLSSNDALAARQLVRSRYDQTTWYELAQPIQNKLRQKRRTALLDYLIAKEGVRDANDLFGKYLIDPEMGDCMMTTRILQATATVQLFIHRCFMGLEPEVPASNINKDRWKWMKNYRVWEANRKVFFYPENWIEPELRDDKSPFFEELESELLQGDITSEKAESALLNYLTKLNEVSRLEVVGMYRDAPKDINGKPKYGFETLYVFSRTSAQPYKYYFRSYHKLGFNPSDGYWTAWQLVDLDIEEIDFVYPFILHNKLYLFWITLVEKAIVEIPEKASIPQKYGEIKFNWSVYENRKWQARKIYELNSQPQKWFFKIPVNQQLGTCVLQGNADDKFNNFSLFVHRLRGGRPYGSMLTNETRSAKLLLNFDGFNINTNIEKLLVYEGPLGPFPRLIVEPWNKEASVPTSIISKVKIFNASTNNLRLLYSHQDLETGPPIISEKLLFRAPVDYSPKSPRFSYSSRFYGAPRHFFFSDDQKNSFLGYPYFIERREYLANIWYDSPAFKFITFYHPQIQQFQQTLIGAGIENFLQLKMQTDNSITNVFSNLQPNELWVPRDAWPNLDVDFSSNGAYSQYNWELFFHLPFIVATHLAKNQRFEEARQWFHYIFNPTDDSPGGIEPQRFWNFRPFHEQASTTPIQQLARILSTQDSSLTSQQRTEKQAFNNQVTQWLANPFKPHAVARWRNRAYMFSVVMKYLDNLIAWGDQLFRRDTREALNEALQIYVLASQILGRKPESVPRRTRPQTRSFADIKGSLDRLSNIQVTAENVLPPSNSPGQTNTPPNLPSLLFCVPENTKILEYYDKVADRLFKLRNCMNIDGVVRQLALFDPPIDPAILVKAAAAGIDLSTALSDLNTPLPLYRFNVISQKATELCAEVKSLGGALLSALEKRDSEAMALLRSKHEISLLKAQRQLKELQVEEAKANIEALGKSLEAAQTRLTYYLSLVSIVEDLTIPTGPVAPQSARLISVALDTLGKTASILQVVTDTTTSATAAGLELFKQILARAADALAPSLATPDGDTNKVSMNPAEKKQLNELKQSHDLQQKGKDYQAVAQWLAKIPDITLGSQGIASPVVVAQLGGSLLSTAALSQANEADYQASEHAYRANLHSILAGYQRRSAEWLQQANLAMIDMEQITKQCIATAVRLRIAAEDLKIHDLQVQNSEQMEEFMQSKYTNQELYDWMVGQISSTYFQSYQLAYDVAKRSEKAYRFELGLTDSDTNFIQFGYWDSMKKGLLAGEKLYHDIKRMEVAYLDQNKREYEIVKHVSLLQINPQALLQLRTTGRCNISLTEELFDMDCPGHYFRRIKNVAVSIPCVIGPYTSVNCTLTLTKSSIRRNTLPSNGYARPRLNDAEDAPFAEDSRFSDYFGSLQSIVTSSGQNDSGLFETNLRDERYLPFEGSGVISDWQIQLPANPANNEPLQFDYDTISDVILHLRYTAREGGGPLKKGAIENLTQKIGEANLAGSVRLFSIRHEFPTEWAKFQSFKIEGTTITAPLVLKLKPEHYPFWSQGRLEAVKEVYVYAQTTKETIVITTDSNGTENNASLVKIPSLGNLRIGKLTTQMVKPTDTLTLYFKEKSIEDLWIAVKWGESGE